MLLQTEWTRPPFLLLALWLLSALMAFAVLDPSAQPKLTRLVVHLVQTRFANDAAQNDHKTSRPSSSALLGVVNTWTANAASRCDHSSELRHAEKKNKSAFWLPYTPTITCKPRFLCILCCIIAE